MQPAGVHLTCLRKDATLIGCWPDALPGEYVILLGSAGPLDGRMSAHAGDVFILELDGAEQRAPLLYSLWLPRIRQGADHSAARQLWIAQIRR